MFYATLLEELKGSNLRIAATNVSMTNHSFDDSKIKKIKGYMK